MEELLSSMAAHISAEPIASTSLVISLVALLVSGGVGWSQFRLNRKEHARITENERRRMEADIDANIVREGGGKYSLKVYNKGEGSARNVSISCEDESPFITEERIREYFPFSELSTHKSVSVPVAFHMGGPKKFHITASWDDQLKSGKSRRIELSR